MTTDINDLAIEAVLVRTLSFDLAGETRNSIDARVEAAVAAERRYGAAGSSRTGVPLFRRLSLRRPTFLAFGALILVGMVSVAGAAVYFGEWGHPATASQIEAEIDATMAVTPLPVGRSYPVDALRSRAEPAGNLTLFAGVQQVQFYAMCAWSGAWLDADINGDETVEAQATEVIATFPTWQSVSDTRLADNSIRTQMKSVVAAAQAGNRGPVQGLFDGMVCSTILGN